jgi:hypothetical protein
MLVNSLLVLAIAVTCGFIITLEERFFLIKLRIVRKYYPKLQELTYAEILEQYDVEALYHDIGKSPYTSIEYGDFQRD